LSPAKEQWGNGAKAMPVAPLTSAVHAPGPVDENGRPIEVATTQHDLAGWPNGYKT
jgi:hypothetical protein